MNIEIPEHLETLVKGIVIYEQHITAALDKVNNEMKDLNAQFRLQHQLDDKLKKEEGIVTASGETEMGINEMCVALSNHKQLNENGKKYVGDLHQIYRDRGSLSDNQYRSLCDTYNKWKKSM